MSQPGQEPHARQPRGRARRRASGLAGAAARGSRPRRRRGGARARPTAASTSPLSSSRTSRVCEPAWSWALRRTRSTWASASRELGVQARRPSPPAAASPVSPTRERWKARCRSLSSWYDALGVDRVDVGGQGRRAPRRRSSSVGRRASARTPATSSTSRARQTSRIESGSGRGDGDAAVGLAGGQALGDQDGQRLADGRPGDAERVGERDLAQRRPGLELAVEDRPPQLVGDPVDGGEVLEVEVERRERLGSRHGRIVPHDAGSGFTPTVPGQSSGSVLRSISATVGSPWLQKTSMSIDRPRLLKTASTSSSGPCS